MFSIWISLNQLSYLCPTMITAYVAMNNSIKNNLLKKVVTKIRLPKSIEVYQVIMDSLNQKSLRLLIGKNIAPSKCIQLSNFFLTSNAYTLVDRDQDLMCETNTKTARLRLRLWPPPRRIDVDFSDTL